MLEYLGSRGRGGRPRLLDPDQDCFLYLNILKYTVSGLGRLPLPRYPHGVHW